MTPLQLVQWDRERKRKAEEARYLVVLVGTGIPWGGLCTHAQATISAERARARKLNVEIKEV